MKGLPHNQLTGRDVGMVITDKKKKQIGCTVRLGSGLWAAWDRHRKLGEYPGPVEAEDAIRKLSKATPGGKPKAWETR